jgi:hypothetical protein
MWFISYFIKNYAKFYYNFSFATNNILPFGPGPGPGEVLVLVLIQSR